MDLGVMPLGDRPADHAGSVLVLPGAWLPVVVDTRWLDTERRVRWVLDNPRLDLVERVRAGFAAHLAERVWPIVMGAHADFAGNQALRTELAVWAAHESARLGLPGASNSGVVLRCTDKRQADEWHVALAGGQRLAQESLSSLGWPRWVGPVVVAIDDAPLDGLAADAGARVLRPTLPLLRLAAQGTAQTTREEAAAAVGLLALDLHSSPDKPWPPWLRTGVAQVLRARARGEGPSPLAMRTKRRELGAEGLAALLTQAEPDPAGCQALLAPLLKTGNRERFAEFLTALSNTSDQAAALRLIYGWTLNDLLEEK